MVPNVNAILIDWGTTNARIFIIDQDRSVLLRTSSEKGILKVERPFELELDGMLRDSSKELASKFSCSHDEAWSALRRVPVVMSGMIGSRNGWIEIPYCTCPARARQHSEHAARYERPTEPQKLIFASGLLYSTEEEDDVMRGEETQIFGALESLMRSNMTACLPGTHSKWVSVESGAITRFATAMTGEMYEVMSKHSILSKSIESAEQPTDEKTFLLGVEKAQSGKGGLLHQLFTVRTASLTDRLPAGSYGSYLSGLLIGTEIRDHTKELTPLSEVIVIGSSSLSRLYQLALGRFGFKPIPVGEEATVQGLLKILDETPTDAIFKSLPECKAPCNPRKNEFDVVHEKLSQSNYCVAILRGITTAEADSVLDALISAGITLIEVPLNSPDAFTTIRRMAERCGRGVSIGAGTVLTVEEVRQLREAGGTFVVSPNTDVAVIKETKKLGMLSFPGVITPTDAISSIQAGADALKYFPAEASSPKGLKATRAVLPKNCPVIPVGGINSGNMKEWVDIAKATAFGIGSNLYAPGKTADQVHQVALDATKHAREALGI